jgi:hypothetical protein
MITSAHRLFQVGGFSPLSLNPALWLSDTGSNAAQWDDLSGNGRHATQGTGVNQPAIVTNALNGRQVRRFDGVNDRVGGSATSFSAFSVFVVFAANYSGAPATAVFGRLFTQCGSANFEDFSQSGHCIPLLRNNNTDTVASWANSAIRLSSAISSTPVISAVIHSGSVLSKWTNGFSDGVFTHTLGNNFSSYAIGGQPLGFAAGNGFFRGDIAEAIVLPYAASTTQRQQVELYLSQKYAIAL